MIGPVKQDQNFTPAKDCKTLIFGGGGGGGGGATGGARVGGGAGVEQLATVNAAAHAAPILMTEGRVIVTLQKG